MTTRRRRNLFPGVPAPGDRDPNMTHAYPGLAEELRAEARQDPALSALQPGETVRVDLGDGPQPVRVEGVTGDADSGTVTVTPLDEDGEPMPIEAQAWRSVGTLADESADLEPADVDAWRVEAIEQRGSSVAPELLHAFGRHAEPAAPVDPHPVWGGSPPQAPESDEAEPVTPAAPERPADVVSGREPDEGHRGPEWRRVVDSADEPVEVRLGCGCQIVIRSCRT